MNSAARSSPKEMHFTATEQTGTVSALLLRPKNARWLLVFGHGAGAGMRHAFMEAMAERLANQAIATFRYQFPYMEQGSKRPNPPTVLRATVCSALATATKAAGDLPLLAGGKSLGGRITSMVVAETPPPHLHGVVFFGFPLHAAGKPSAERGVHLAQVQVPMLFLQGTRDTLAELTLLRPVCRRLGKRATLHVIDGADHSFRVLKSAGKTDDEVRTELAHTVSDWAATL